MLGLAVAAALQSAGQAAAHVVPVECWRGWAYRMDGQTRTYKSSELLLVTKGAASWQAGARVMLHQLDRTSGRIAAGVPPIVVELINPRVYYRDNFNYVDGEGTIIDSDERLVFGLSHFPPPVAAVDQLLSYNQWLCGQATAP